MLRYALFATLALNGCGRSTGVSDEQLGGLVLAPKTADQPIDLSRAVREPAELGRAASLPYRKIVDALGAHTFSFSTATTVDEAGKRVSELSDHTTIELGDKGSFHALYTNSSDYGREVSFVVGKLYLRPRYQRWHGRAPETPEEPVQIRDSFFEAMGATWDLLAPGIELTDAGVAQVAGRAGRKIVIKQAPTQRQPPPEPLTQRKWREKRTVEGITGEIVLDADKGVPLSMKLSGTVGFSRDGRRFAMKIAFEGSASAIGQAVAIAVPPGDQVVATPERMREVDDRDFLLQGIAPPLRRNPDGTAVTPQAPQPAAPAAPAAGSNSK